jgi:V/A-type H+-transporting ATPase subunit K
MNGLIALAVLPAALTLCAGVWLELKPQRGRRGWVLGSLVASVVLFVLAVAAITLAGVQQVLAAEPLTEAGGITLGQGLALLGVGLPTGLAAIGAAIALGPIGSAGLAVIAEKPEMFGRTLIYMGLAEGIAIYGLVMSILLLGRV